MRMKGQLTLAALVVLLQSIGSNGRTETLASFSDSQAATAPSRISPGISLQVVVSDGADRYVSGLPSAKFSFTAGGNPISARLQGENLPLSVLVLVDVSGSSTRLEAGRKFQLNIELQRALAAFLEARTTSTELAVATFAETQTLLADFTSDVSTLVRPFDRNLTLYGRTRILDACDFGIGTLARASNPRRVILVLSDGLDNSSKISLEKVREKLERVGVVVYAVKIASEFDPLNADALLRNLAVDTGGLFLTLNRRLRLEGACAAIATDLNNVYTFTMSAEHLVPGRGYAVKVRVLPPASKADREAKLSVRVRRNYRL